MSFSTYYILYVTSVTRGLSIKLKWKMFAKCFCEKSGRGVSKDPLFHH